MIYAPPVGYWSSNQYFVKKNNDSILHKCVDKFSNMHKRGLETALLDMYLLESGKYTNTNVVARMILHRLYILIRIDRKYVQGDQGQHQDLRRQALWQRRQASTKP